MDKSMVFERIKSLGLLAVIRGPSEQKTLKAVEALVKGGVKGIEITYSTPNAGAVVKALDREYGDEILLGMGTLTEPGQVKEAAENGAKFIVSPILEPALVEAFLESGLLSMVGCFTPSEVFKAYEMGADIIKIFPGRLAGPAYIKDLRGPFPHIPFIPTGGVSKENVGEWFKAGVIAVGAGSNLCPKELMLNEKYEQITAIAREFVEAVNKAKLR
ncbi:MAG: bifunctional 4-hydroxy-2-oxoglutarate aldolase/2-dehydro-3-deoxy-phosphogluconate aldolase [Firmicutes bacterium]|nr:bifunctional 4-hydroxy-2-oxoglutarate aldolase/2-dehydro-3-deoxy-phosphogluconate aldolase [Bacillota bacterium]HPU01914.1 bifunctional 4-hydroxy-2-oxoglutarate aldolase/2-dehydro-3-deoxy-phosphogluconate aldolase [Bacillota bacterium]